MNVHVDPAQVDLTAAHPDAVQVKSVRLWTDTLFSFRIERPKSLRFRSGEFVMIGLVSENGKPILRAYSIASPSWDDELEFYSIIAPDGQLTPKLKLIQPGSSVILRPKPTGTLVLDALLPGKRLFLVSTGTGFAPFASLIRDPETYEKYDQVILTHTCRTVAELEYGRNCVTETLADPLIGEFATRQLIHYPTTTQESSPFTGRITELFQSGRAFEDLGIEGLDADSDRIMVCGSMSFNNDMRAIAENLGFSEGSNANPGTYVVEKAFVGE